MKTFPPFSDYQDVFGSPLPARMFAKFGQPNSLPSPANLLRLSRVIYPYWRERRTERAGKRIIPTVNVRDSIMLLYIITYFSFIQGDETDTLNESYVCFRRREVKTSRKLRNSQTSVPERFKRFTEEWAVPEQLLQAIVHRENVKREHLVHSAHVMSARLEMLDLMKKNPGLAEKRDEELLIDREKPAKRHPERWVSFGFMCFRMVLILFSSAVDRVLEFLPRMTSGLRIRILKRRQWRSRGICWRVYCRRQMRTWLEERRGIGNGRMYLMYAI